MKFSVLMSVYQKEQPAFLQASLDSIFSQTRLPDEIVIVKDGPLTDALEKVLAENTKMAPVHVRLLVLPENRGLGAALQAGLEVCVYPWIARADTDDINRPDRFAQQVVYLEAHPDVDAVGSWIAEFDQDPATVQAVRQVPLTAQDICRYARFRNPMNHMTVFFRKEAVLAVGGYQPFLYMEDYYLWYRMLRQGNKFANLPETLVFARVGNDMISRRRGGRYFAMERKFYGVLRRDGFISFLDYIYILSVRWSARAMPRFVTSFIYKLLRS